MNFYIKKKEKLSNKSIIDYKKMIMKNKIIARNKHSFYFYFN